MTMTQIFIFALYKLLDW